MLFPVLADLQVAGKINDLANQCLLLARVRFAVPRSADGGRGPWLRGRFTELTGGRIIAASLHFHLRLEDGGSSSGTCFLLSLAENVYRQGKDAERRDDNCFLKH